ncbi:MAG: xylulokinase [Ruminococcaceae bacterium]|nr:xylulokinase [Oscillospiraceae bacterium]
MKYLLGIDFGGGASKATLLSKAGTLCATNTCEYPTRYPKAGYVEQDPQDWVRVTVENITAILEKSGVRPCDIVAVSLDAATHTAVILDEDFQVIRPAIYWTDTRSTREVEYLQAQLGDVIEKQVLHRPDTIWSLPALLWIKNNEPDAWRKVRKIMFPKDYVRHFLTGDYVTDFIEAEGSMLFDVNTMAWSETLCGVLGLTPQMLPTVVKPTDIVGKITREAATLTGLTVGTPVLCGTTDTVMEVFASGAVSQGNMTVKLATAGRICVITDRPYPNRHLVNYSHVIDGLYYPGTGTKSCAASYRWFRDTFGEDYASLDRQAENICIGCDGLVFHPYLNGELTPYANPNLCADFVGIRAFHTKAHFARAVLEGVAMSMLDCKLTLEKLHIPHEDRAVIIGGGGKSPLWRQMVSDALGIKLIEMQYSDSSFGSAMLAGVATHMFSGYADALKKCNASVSETVPNAAHTEKYLALYNKYKKIQEALEPIYNAVTL